jgi:regulator of replication initiation timing
MSDAVDPPESLPLRVYNLQHELTQAYDKIEELTEVGLRQMDTERSLKSELTELRERMKANYKVTLAIERMLYEAREQRDKLVNALERIEERYVDGWDTHEDWKAMGEMARQALAEVKQESHE